MGTNVKFSTAYHPQTQGQVERVNQILEDMLRACVISFGMKWEECLQYAEFSYNNSYQASLQASPLLSSTVASAVLLSIGIMLSQKLVKGVS